MQHLKTTTTTTNGLLFHQTNGTTILKLTLFRIIQSSSLSTMMETATAATTITNNNNNYDYIILVDNSKHNHSAYRWRRSRLKLPPMSSITNHHHDNLVVVVVTGCRCCYCRSAGSSQVNPDQEDETNNYNYILTPTKVPSPSPPPSPSNFNKSATRTANHANRPLRYCCCRHHHRHRGVSSSIGNCHHHVKIHHRTLHDTLMMVIAQYTPPVVINININNDNQYIGQQYYNHHDDDYYKFLNIIKIELVVDKSLEWLIYSSSSLRKIEITINTSFNIVTQATMLSHNQSSTLVTRYQHVTTSPPTPPPPLQPYQDDHTTNLQQSLSLLAQPIHDQHHHNNQQQQQQLQLLYLEFLKQQLQPIGEDHYFIGPLDEINFDHHRQQNDTHYDIIPMTSSAFQLQQNKQQQLVVEEDSRDDRNQQQQQQQQVNSTTTVKAIMASSDLQRQRWCVTRSKKLLYKAATNNNKISDTFPPSSQVLAPCSPTTTSTDTTRIINRSQYCHYSIRLNPYRVDHNETPHCCRSHHYRCRRIAHHRVDIDGSHKVESFKSTRDNNKQQQQQQGMSKHHDSRPGIARWKDCGGSRESSSLKHYLNQQSNDTSTSSTAICSKSSRSNNIDPSTSTSTTTTSNESQLFHHNEHHLCERRNYNISTMLFHFKNAKFKSRTSCMANNLLALYLLILFLSISNQFLPSIITTIQTQQTLSLNSAKSIYVGLPKILSVHSLTHITTTTSNKESESSSNLDVERPFKLPPSPLFEIDELPSRSARANNQLPQYHDTTIVDSPLNVDRINIGNNNLHLSSKQFAPKQRYNNFNKVNSRQLGSEILDASEKLTPKTKLLSNPIKQELSNNNNRRQKIAQQTTAKSTVDPVITLERTIEQTYDMNDLNPNQGEEGDEAKKKKKNISNQAPKRQTAETIDDATQFLKAAIMDIEHNDNNAHNDDDIPPLDNTHASKKHHRRDTINQQKLRHRSRTRATTTSYITRPLVQTNKGLVRGVIQQTVTGKNVEVFLGVPYAKPPIGRYRFRHPQPIDPWQGELDASKFAKSCYQVNDTFFGNSFRGTSMWNANTPLGEDCLHLNIWAPMGSSVKYISRSSNSGQDNNEDNLSPSSSLLMSSDGGGGGGGAYVDNDNSDEDSFSHHKRESNTRYRSRSPSNSELDSKRLRPVLVWIFGGGFYYGTSSLSIYDGGILASEEDILVVSMNYRVAAIGFLYFGRPDAPGNSGLFDQLMALQWLHENVEQFGGDPNRITIFGESAGAVSVAYHLLSPLSRNLFSQAILQSGAATNPWGMRDTKEIIQLGLELAKALNCPDDMNDFDAVIQCLIQVDPMVLVTQNVGHYKNVVDFPFVPVVDGSFLLEDPAESLAKSNFKKTRLLLGSNSDEGNFFLIYHIQEFNRCPATSSSTTTPTTSSTIRLNASSSLLMANMPTSNTNNMNSIDNRRLSLANQDDDINDDQYISPAAAAASRQNKQQSNPAYDTLMMSSEFAASPSPSLSSSSSSSEQQASNNDQPLDGGPTCRPPDHLSMEREDFLRLVKDDLNPFAYENLGRDAIIYEYTNWNNPNDSISNYDAMDKIVGDYYFTCHVNEFAHKYALGGNSVYMYYFKHRSTVSPWPEWMGVLHADEINFIFGEPLNPIYGYSAPEIQLSRRMMNYWANFAKYGNPTRINETNLLSEQWPQYSNNREYLELQTGSATRIGHGPRAKKCAFWQHYLPKLLNTSGQAQGINGCLGHLQEGKSRFLLGGSSKQPIILAVTGIVVIILILLLLVLAKRTWKPDLNVTAGD